MTGYQWLDLLIVIAVALLLTCLLLIAALAIGRSKGQTPQLAAAYRRFSSNGAVPVIPSHRRILQQKLLAFVGYYFLVLAILNVIWFGLSLSGAPGERVVESTSTQSATPSGRSSSAARSPASAPRIGSAEGQTGPRSGSAKGQTIQLGNLANSGRPFQTVRIHGMYRGGADTLLLVQRWEGGKWVALPLSIKTNQSGQFTTYVEFGRPGRYQLRVQDPDSGTKSKPFVLVIWFSATGPAYRPNQHGPDLAMNSGATAHRLRIIQVRLLTRFLSGTRGLEVAAFGGVPHGSALGRCRAADPWRTCSSVSSTNSITRAGARGFAARTLSPSRAVPASSSTRTPMRLRNLGRCFPS